MIILNDFAFFGNLGGLAGLVFGGLSLFAGILGLLTGGLSGGAGFLAGSLGGSTSFLAGGGSRFAVGLGGFGWFGVLPFRPRTQSVTLFRSVHVRFDDALHMTSRWLINLA